VSDDLNLPAFVPPPMSAALDAELASLAPVKTRQPMRQFAKLAIISLVYSAGLLAILTVRDDAGELPMGWMIAAGLAWLSGFALPLYLALVPGPGAVMPRWKLAGGAAIAMAIFFVALGLAIHPSGHSSVQYGAERFVHGHWCLELGLATAIVPVICGAIFLRGALPVASRWVAAGLGAGGGSLGGLVLHLHCHITDALHVGLIHGGVVGVSALLAAAIVPRATEPR
jgi:hypothetical protein